MSTEYDKIRERERQIIKNDLSNIDFSDTKTQYDVDFQNALEKNKQEKEEKEREIKEKIEENTTCTITVKALQENEMYVKYYKNWKTEVLKAIQKIDEVEIIETKTESIVNKKKKTKIKY